MAIDWSDERLPAVTGQGRYVDDLAPEGCLHVVFLRSPHASARIAAIDTTRAAALDGVARVFTGRDLDGVVGPIKTRMDEADWYRYRQTAWPVLAVEAVRFVGEAVAAVVASDVYAAEDACALIAVDYEPVEAVVEARAAIEPGAVRVHAGIEDNVLFASRFRTEGAVDPFDGAAYRVAGMFRHPRVAPAPIECCGAVATYDRRNGVIELCTPTQAPHMIRDGLARFLGHPETHLHVTTPDVGGAFGGKMPLYPEEVFVAFAARALGRPVKWTQDRREHQQASFQARDATIAAELAADADGRILGLRARLWCDVGAYSAFPLGCSLEPHTAMVGLPGPYDIPYFDFESHAVATNKCPTGPYRGVGFVLGPLATESLIDKMARAIGIDRIEIRRRNLIPAAAFPYKSASGAIYDSGDYPGLIDKALARAAGDLDRSGADAEADGVRVGVGITCFIEPTAMGCNVFRGRGMHEIPAFDSALVRVNRSGSVEAYVTTPTQGQQQFTSMRRLLSGILAVPEAEIVVRFGDTATMPYGSGTFASRGTVSGGGALQRAGRRVIARMKALAALRFEIDADEVTFEDGRFGNGRNANQFATFGEIAEFAHAPVGGLPPDFDHGLQCTASYDNPGTAVSAGAHVAVVEVDTRTGDVRVVRYVVAEDCGPIINLEAVDGQIQGAVMQGIGTALLEEVRYDAGGQLQSATLADYLLPSADGAPQFDIVHQETPSPLTEGGFKGMGESGTIGAPAAIASAVMDAIGVDWAAIDLPLTPERVLALIEE